MDMNTTDIYNGALEFFSGLVSACGLKFRESILDVGPKFDNCNLQVCIVQCFYMIFILRKVSRKMIAFLTFPILLLIILPSIALGKILPIVSLVCWWTCVQFAPEPIALLLLLVFITLFTVSEIAMVIFVVTSGLFLSRRGLFSLVDYSLQRRAFLYVLVAMTIFAFCYDAEIVNEIFVVPIYIVLFFKTGLVYLPDLAILYLCIAGSTYAVALMLHLYNYLVVEPWIFVDNWSREFYTSPEL